MIGIVEALIFVVAGEASMELDFLGYFPHLHAYGGLVNSRECTTYRLLARDGFTTGFCPSFIRRDKPSHHFDNTCDNACFDDKAVRQIVCRCSERITISLFHLLV